MTADFRSASVAASAGVNLHELTALHDVATRHNSDGLHVRLGGQILLDWASDLGSEPIETMSVSKSIVSILVGRLLELGLLTTIDDPVACYVPEWMGTAKEAVTLRHILEHRSGLASDRDTDAIYASKDFVRFAIEADLVSEPGSRYRYNNCAVNLLSRVIEDASGRRADEFARAELFGPLGIDQWTWALDGAGNPSCMAGIRLRARDLATIGQLMLQKGEWQGASLLSPSWVDESTGYRPGPVQYSCGLMWKLVGKRVVVLDDDLFDEWRTATPNVPESFIDIVRPLKDQPMERGEFLREISKAFGTFPDEPSEWHEQTWQKGLPDGRIVLNEVWGYCAEGFGGQYLVVLPDSGMVAARLRAVDPTITDVESFAMRLRWMTT